MKPREHVRVAGLRTVADWNTCKATLTVGGPPAPWAKAFRDFFYERIKTRYFEPIKAINAIGAQKGEGFSIVAIQCSLVEFLQATRKGLKYVLKNPDPNNVEYSRSKEMFVEFLTSVDPFDGIFTCNGKYHKFGCRCKAEDFYEGVRCGLLHEARTKKGWKIHVSVGVEACIDFDDKIVYRDQLQKAFRRYVVVYGLELKTDTELQKAFIRKFDDLCAE